ncbi:MAG TPA: flavodoxin domain-containing protein [Anaerolineae bacterium]|nr:flavodoxin domain-containing protein [Anaerolineae bacterium]
MDKILVAYATKYGSTKGIAERIGQALREAGLQVDIRPAGDVRDLAPYHAVVLGSAVYIFRWRREAVRLLRALAALPGRPVWLFSSGPTSETDTDAFPGGLKLPKAMQPFADRLRVRDAAVFRGVNDPQKMNALERWMMSNMKAPSGDFREWDAIDAWARGIAQALLETGA